MDIARIQARLYNDLAIGGAVALACSLLLHHLAWGTAAALGLSSCALYYWLLGFQIDRQLSQRRFPAPPVAAILLLLRQVVCVVPCAVAFGLWGFGGAFWALLGALFLGRHWVMVAVSRHAGRPAPATN